MVSAREAHTEARPWYRATRSPLLITIDLTYLPVLESQKAWAPRHQAAWSVKRTKLAGLNTGDGHNGEKSRAEPGEVSVKWCL